MNKDSYATYAPLPHLSNNIIEFLIESTEEEAELLWKLIKYNKANAYMESNLTRKEKRDLIYKGQPNEEKINVYLDYMMDDAVNDMKTFLRIYPAEVYPTTRVTGLCSIYFEIFVHSKINHLDNYTTRLDSIVQLILHLLNGVHVGGIGVLFFDNQGDRYNRIITTGQKPYKGKIIKMSTILG